MFQDTRTGTRLIQLIGLIVAAILSITVLSPIVSSADFHSASIATLDEQKQTAMGLTATVTAASYAISAIPNDTASPIADQLADLTGPLMVVVCVIYLEKFLLTTTGFLSFTFLIPFVCLLFGISLFRPAPALRQWGVKLLIFAVLMVLLVPTGVAITGMVQDTFQESIEQTYSVAEQFTQEVESAQDSDTNAVVKFFEGIGDSVAKLFDMAKKVLSTVTDAIAVLLITTCAIPLLTLLLFTWIVRTIFGLQLNIPAPALPRPRRKKPAGDR